ncbi:MAG: hypothetical protein ACJ76F_00070 [Bacteroidia bacterium]
MNPFKKFKYWIAGEAIAQTDDVFEKARIELTYNFTLFFMFLGLMFYGNLIVNHYNWQIYITTFGVITLPFVLVVLKRTRNVKKAALLFMINQLIVSCLSEWIYKFAVNAQGVLWSVISLIFAFFVLGKKWGWGVTLFVAASLIIGPLDKVLKLGLTDYYIPPGEIVPEESFFILIPFLIVVYGMSEIVNTRLAAEKKINQQKELLEGSNKALSEKNKDILDSIHYAQRIQRSLLPPDQYIERSLKRMNRSGRDEKQE